MNLRKLAIIAILLTVFCLVVACTEGCDVVVEQPLNSLPVFHLKKNLQAADGVEMSVFQVARKVGSKYELVWSIRRADISKPIMIETITYGVVPPGFEEEPKAMPLIKGEAYDILLGRPGMSGGEIFVFKGN